jgi:clan AA aspartic protease
MGIASEGQGPFLELDALVDTGAFYTWVPASILQGIGIEPHTTRSFVIANGERIERRVGRAWVRVDGEVESTLVIFGDEGSQSLLGAYTLEAFALAVDPVNRRLLPLSVLPVV